MRYKKAFLVCSTLNYDYDTNDLKKVFWILWDKIYFIGLSFSMSF
jgi:hypothetical protein